MNQERMVFRRKKERQFIRSMIGFQVIIALCLLLGVGLTIRNLRQEYERHIVLNTAIHTEVERARKDIQELLSEQKKGYRFTAGNAWQLAQLVIHGEVDMINFPDHDLIYPDQTWFQGYLVSEGLLVTD